MRPFGISSREHKPMCLGRLTFPSGTASCDGFASEPKQLTVRHRVNRSPAGLGAVASNAMA
jgi:hypothetical protein